MWICLNNAFLSIVDPAGAYSGGERRGPDLLVRARYKGDIEAVFPLADVKQTPQRDYMYRATVPRADVAAAIQNQVMRLDYSNFKGSVKDQWRHDVYLDFWHITNREQRRQHSKPPMQRRGSMLDGD
jgi:hypothetical protein